MANHPNRSMMPKVGMFLTVHDEDAKIVGVHSRNEVDVLLNNGQVVRATGDLIPHNGRSPWAHRSFPDA